MAYYYKNASMKSSFETDSDDEFLPVLKRFFNQKNQSITVEEKRRRQQRRNEREHRLFMELKGLPEIKPIKPYDIYLIHRFTSLMYMYVLLDRVRKVKKFTIDTEGDFPYNKPTLIQIESVDENEAESLILLVEMAHLPPPSARLFRFIQALFSVILDPSNKIYAWSNVKDELLAFVQYNVFTSEMVQSIHMYDVQYHFKHWYNDRFPHNEGCIGKYTRNDSQYCRCSHRPYKYPDQKWSLQLAIAKTFNEFLDKRLRKSQWSQGLDYRFDPNYRLTGPMENKSPAYQRRQDHREQLIKYAASDCLSTTKLAMIVENKWTRDELEEYCRHQ